jgi:hypothetical protein
MVPRACPVPPHAVTAAATAAMSATADPALLAFSGCLVRRCATSAVPASLVLAALACRWAATRGTGARVEP